MSFLDGLGLGAYSLGNLGQSYPFIGNPQAMAGIMQSQYIPYPVCMHSNCPICKEIRDKEILQITEQKKVTVEKEKTYKEKCIKYMDWFHTRGRNHDSKDD